MPGDHVQYMELSFLDHERESEMPRTQPLDSQTRIVAKHGERLTTARTRTDISKRKIYKITKMS